MTLATAVFDCMVFLQGAARPNGPAAGCLELVEAGHVQLFLSQPVLSEIEEVLARPRIRTKFPTLTDDRVHEFLKRLRDKASFSNDPPSVITLERDPKDEKYLNLAAATAVSYLVSRDKDLLETQDANNPCREQFLRFCPATRPVTPNEFLRIVEDLRQTSTKTPEA